MPVGIDARKEHAARDALAFHAWDRDRRASSIHRRVAKSRTASLRVADGMTLARFASSISR
jgi:hypothetical protein